MSQDPQENSGPTPAQPQRPSAYPSQPQQPPYPAQPQPYPAQPYPPQAYPGQAQAYPGQPQYPVQPYPGQAQSPYGVQPYQGAGYPGGYPATGYQGSGSYGPPAKPRSPILGIVGLGIVVVTGIIAILIGFSMAGPMAELMAYVPPGSTQIDASRLPPELLEAMVGPMTGLGLASFAGFVGWIISIVAAATNRGRGWGVAGIILGILAPIAVLLAMSVAVAAIVA